MDEDEENTGLKDGPTDDLHKSVSKTGLIILGIGLYLLLFPLWDVMVELDKAESQMLPVKIEFAQIKQDGKELAEADPESPMVVELKEREAKVLADLREKITTQKFFKKKFIVFVIVMAFLLLVGFIVTIFGLIMCYDYRSKFNPPEPDDEESEEGGEE